MSIELLTHGLFGGHAISIVTDGLVVPVHPHPRARIRERIVQILSAAAMRSDMVIESPYVPTPDSSLPVIFVWSGDEDPPKERQEVPLELTRRVVVVVEPVFATSLALSAKKLQSAVDAVARVIEQALLNTRAAGGVLGLDVAKKIELGPTETDGESSGSRLIVHAKVSFYVTYFDEFSIGADAAELASIVARYDVVPSDGVNEATDVIPIGEV